MSRDSFNNKKKYVKLQDTTLESLTDVKLDQIPISNNVPLKKGHQLRGSETSTTSASFQNDIHRDLWGGSKSNVGDQYSFSELQADPFEYYDMFAQGWRMVGGFISCDQFSSANESGDRRDLGSGSGDGDENCARWILWAAYINPNYAGGGAEEYGLEGYGRKRRLDEDENNNNNDDLFSASSKLDCYNPQSAWQLLGLYRIDVDNFLEQMAKHIWASGTYEYVTMYAALDYINGGKCKETGEYDKSGNAVYAALGFTGSGGSFEMKLYSDEKCIYEATNLKFSYDDLGWETDFDMGSGDDAYYYGADDTLLGYWKNAQEASLTELNNVLDDMRACLLCIDYPS